MWFAYMRLGSVSTMICRTLPPYGSGMDAPFTLASRGRMNEMPRSYRSASLRPSPLSASCTMGTLLASYLRMLGGKVPGGSTRRMVCTTAVICETASSTFTLGWK